MIDSKVEGDVIFDLLSGNPGFKIGGTSSLLVRTKFAKEIGGFDESFKRHQEWEFLIRLLRDKKLKMLREPLWVSIGDNSPNAEKMEKVKKKFLIKFKREINSFGKKGARLIYGNQYLSLSLFFFRQGDIGKGLFYLKKSMGYGSPFQPLIKYFYLCIACLQGINCNLRSRF